MCWWRSKSVRFATPSSSLRPNGKSYSTSAQAAEREVPRIDLVAERLTDLADAERHTDSRRVAHVLEVHEDSLRRFRAQVRDARIVLERADVRLEHQVERARRGQRAGRGRAGRDDLRAHALVLQGV